MVELKTLIINTEHYNEFINITLRIEALIQESSVKNGIVLIATQHTTTGITLNESLECLQKDMGDMLDSLAPEDASYNHARMLHSYGTTAGNPTGHLKSHLTGSQVVMPISEGKLLKGGAQDIFFCEFDGAQRRKIFVQIIGE